MNTKDKEYTEEYIDTLKKLTVALHKISIEYKGDPAKTGVKAKDDGSYEVFVDKGPTFWFQDDVELASWVLGINYDN